jgi:hypothetical protein
MAEKRSRGNAFREVPDEPSRDWAMMRFEGGVIFPDAVELPQEWDFAGQREELGVERHLVQFFTFRSSTGMSTLWRTLSAVLP